MFGVYKQVAVVGVGEVREADLRVVNVAEDFGFFGGEQFAQRLQLSLFDEAVHFLVQGLIGEVVPVIA